MIMIRQVLADFLTGRRRKRLRSALAVFLALAVVFSVYGSLIRPAVSATGDPLEIKGVPSSDQTGVFTVDAKVTGDNKQDPKKYMADITAKFNIKNEDITSLKQDHGNSITFDLWQNGQIPPELEIANVVNEGEVYTSGSDKTEIGHYVFDPDTGKVIITFDFDSPYFVGREDEAIGGGFNFQAWSWNQDNSTNDKSYNIAGNSVTVPIYRYTHTADLTVKKSYNNDFFYPTEGVEMGTGDDALRARGSSFKINVISHNGVDGREITFTDSLKSDHVHFDLVPNMEWPVYDSATGNKVNDVSLRIVSVDGADGEQVLSAKIVAANDTVLKEGFDYYWNCPVTVNDEYVNQETGELLISKESFSKIEGDNTISAKAKDVPVSSSDAKIQVGLIADIAKSNGVYNPETNKIHWVYTIYKDNGWWREATLRIDDKIGGPDGTPPEISGLTMKVVPQENSISDRVDPDPATNGVNPISYDQATGRFTITMEKDNVQYEGHTYNKKPIKEFIVEYDTPVTSDDYGDRINNWVGLVDPDEPSTYNDIDPDKYATVPKPSVSKDHVLGEDGIIWKITVNNRTGQDLSGLILTDNLKYDGSAIDAPDFSSADAQLTVTADGSSVSAASLFNVSGNTLTFKNDTVKKNASSYVITYKQPIADMSAYQNKSFTNTVDLNNGEPDSEPLSSDSDDAHIPRNFEVEKEGFIGADGLMHYRVTFVNQYGMDLNGQYITDVMRITKGSENINAEGFTVTMISPETGVNFASVAEGDTITSTITVNGTNTSRRLTVEYTVAPPGPGKTFRSDNGYQIDNTASWGDEQDTDHHEVNEFVFLEYKNGSYDSNTDYITWQFKIVNAYKLDLSAYPTADSPYKILDDMFKAGNSNHLTDLKITNKEGEDVTGNALEEILNSGGYYSFKEGMNSEYYVFTYKTKARDIPSDQIKQDNGVDAKNDVYYVNGEEIIDSEEAVVQVKTWEFPKRSNKRAEAGPADSDGSFQIKFTLELSTYPGGFLFGMQEKYNIEDDMSAKLKGEASEDVKLYISPDMFTSDFFTLKFVNKNWQDITGNLDFDDVFELYPVTSTDDGITKFRIAYKEADPDSEVYRVLSEANNLTITYTAKAEGAQHLRDADMEYNDKITYSNTLNYPGVPDKTATHELVKRPAINKTIFDYSNQWGGYTDQNKDFGLSVIGYDENTGKYSLTYMLTLNEFNSFDNATDIVVTDQLPENFIYKAGTGTYSLGNNGTQTGILAESEADGGVSWAQNGNELTFTVPSSIHDGGKVTINYSVEISSEDLFALLLRDDEGAPNGKAIIKNTAETNGELDTVQVTLTDDSPKVTKSGKTKLDGNNKPINNAVTYTLDINPNARKLLPEGDSLVVRDTINLADDGQHALCPILFTPLSPDSVKVYSVDEDGNETLLTPEEFGFTIPIRKTYPVADGVHGDGDVYIFELTVPDQTHIRIVYDYTFEFNLQAKSDDSFNTDNMKLKNNAVISGLQAESSEDKSYSFNKNQSSGAYADSVPRINLRKVSTDNWLESLPGAEFILQRYDTVNKSWETLTGTEAKEVYEESTLYMEHDSSQIDHSKDIPLHSSAFGIWDSSDSATPMKLITSEEKGQIEFPSLQRYVTKEVTVGEQTVTRNYFVYNTDALGRQRYIYKLTETKAPSGYFYKEGTNDHYFYEQPKDETMAEAKPANTALQQIGITSADLMVVRSGTKIELANNACELDVRKYWNGGTSLDELALKLYRTTTPPESTANNHIVKLTINEGNNSSDCYALVADGEYFKAKIIIKGNGWLNTQGSGVSCAQPGGDIHLVNVTSSAPVTGDSEFSVTLSHDSSTPSLIRTSENVKNYSPGFDISTAEFVQDITLTAKNGWYTKLEDIDLKDTDYYYYIVEETPEGYDANYLTNGLQNGTFKLTNEAYPAGSIKVNKQWYGDEPDTEKVTFNVYGYTVKTAQPESQYHSLTQGTVVNIRVNENNGQYVLTKAFAADAGETYYLTVTGDYQNYELGGGYTVGGTSYHVWNDQYFVNNTKTFTVPIPADAAATTVDVVININDGGRSGGNFTFSCKDSSDNSVTVQDSISAADLPDEFEKAAVALPDGAECVVEKTLTVYKNEDWSGVLDGLRITTAEGDPIYYYVEETESGLFQAIDYSDNGFAVTEDQAVEMTVLNQPNESPQKYSLPETGGSGKALFFISGAGLMLAAAIYFIINKRREQE